MISEKAVNYLRSIGVSDKQINTVVAALKAEPIRPRGHWIDTGWVCQTDEIIYGYGCSECGGISFFRKYDNKILGGKWCHYCGADMQESEE